MLTAIFPLKERGFAFGIQTTVGGVFMSMGPLIGGFLADSISWRWIFWINLPVVAAVGAIVLAAWVPSREEKRLSAPRAPVSFDFPGLITLVAGLTALVVALMQGTEWGWRSPVILSLFFSGTIGLIFFTIIELRRTHALIEIELLRIATFTGGNLVFFIFQFNKIAVFVFLALYLQEKLRQTPIAAGAVILIAVLPTLITSLIAGKSADRFGSRRSLLTGLLLNGSAIILIGFATVQDNYAMVVAPPVIWGATLPFIAVASRRALMSAVPKTQQGQASGLNLTIQMLGGTVGMALCGTVLVATGDYRSLFLMTGALIFLTLICGWLTIER